MYDWKFLHRRLNSLEKAFSNAIKKDDGALLVLLHKKMEEFGRRLAENAEQTADTTMDNVLCELDNDLYKM
jgi:hypothetical protein